jgi:hypothetical protein
MNVFVLISKPDTGGVTGGEPVPWTMNNSVFETQEEAVAWAERNLTGQTWRLVMFSSISVIQ